MVKLSDFNNRAEFMAYVRAQKGKNNSNVKKTKTKKGKGIMSDVLSNIKDVAIKEGEKVIKEKGNELLNKGVDTLVKKIRGKGLLKDIGKTVFKGAMSAAPIPGIVRDVGTNVGELLIDKIGGSLNDKLVVTKGKTLMVKKNMNSKSGAALKPMGF